VNKNNKSLLPGLLVGLALGLTFTVLLADEENRNRVKKSFRKFKRYLGDTDIAQSYRMVKDELIYKLKNSEGKFKDISKDRFSDIVEDTIEELKDKLNIPEKRLDRIGRFLKRDYETIRNELKDVI
jgi:gas vesicle protein